MLLVRLRRRSRRSTLCSAFTHPALSLQPGDILNKNFLLATLAAGATLFVLGFVIYGLVLANFFDHAAMRIEPAMGPLVLGHLVLGAFVVLVLVGWRGVENAANGFKAGATAGVLMSLAVALTMMGTMDNMFTTATVIGDAAVSLVTYGIAGAVVAAVLDRSGGPASRNRDRGGIRRAPTRRGDPAQPAPAPGLRRGASVLASWKPGQPSRAGCAP